MVLYWTNDQLLLKDETKNEVDIVAEVDACVTLPLYRNTTRYLTFTTPPVSPEPTWPQVSLPKLKVALALARVELTSEELSILEAGFKSDRNADLVRAQNISTTK